MKRKSFEGNQSIAANSHLNVPMHIVSDHQQSLENL